ncbi:hypothetical protein FQA39_LY18621 [Lamprigera yunnana]|nr:hypothetical protein FQA39_LY18621 [Lamprigera yunnana]
MQEPLIQEQQGFDVVPAENLQKDPEISGCTKEYLDGDQNREFQTRSYDTEKPEILHQDISTLSLSETGRVAQKETYIRSLAHVWKELGVGAYLTQLRRPKSEIIKIEDATDQFLITISDSR